MKSLVVTDTHLGLYSDSDIWLKVVYDFFDHIFDYCEENNINNIIHCGDFFHNRKILNTKTQNIAIDIAKRKPVDLQCYIAVGNHDCYYKNKIHPNTLRLFDEYSTISIIDKPFKIDNITIIPWKSPNQDFKWYLPDADYCFGHFEISGFHMNDTYICRNGFDSNVFKKYKKVFSGHFHTPSVKGNIRYLGSPFQQTFHDEGSDRGFYIFEDEKLEFIKYDKAPKFIRMKTEKIDFSKIEGNVVKLIFDEDYGTVKNQKIIDECIKMNPLKFSPDFTKVASIEDTDQENVKMEKREDMIKNYIENNKFPENINKKTLNSMFIKMMNEGEGEE